MNDRSVIEIISWVLAMTALCAGIVMKTDWFPLEVIRWSGLVVAMTTAVNQFILTHILKKVRKNGK